MGLHLAVLAQEVYDPNPTVVGAPGGDQLRQAIDWLAGYALYAAIAALIVGGIKIALARRSGSGVGSHEGQQWVIGGMFAAVIIGAAAALVEFGLIFGQGV